MTKEKGLRWRFLVIFLPLAALVAFAAYWVGQARTDAELYRLGTDETTRVRLGVNQLLGQFRIPQHHLMSLPTERAIRSAIDDRNPENMAEMAEAFTTLLDRNPEYDQVRWIDESGMEQVRIRRDTDGTSVVQTPQSDLQNRSGRYFVKDALRLKAGDIYISQLDLTKNQDIVVLPYRPTLRFITVVVDRTGTHRGIIVLNYMAGPVLADFVTATSSGNGRAMLLNRQGYWLSSSDPADEWGFDLGLKTTLGSRFPEAWNRIDKADHGQFIDKSGQWTWQAATPTTAAAGPQRLVNAPTWIVVSHLPIEIIQTIYARAWLPTGVTFGLVILFLAILSWLIAMHSKQKGDKLRSEAEAAESRRRVADLEAAQKVGARLTAIVNSTQDAIIGKSLDGIVTSWNSGAEKLFGYRSEEAIGQSIELLLAPRHEDEEQRIFARFARGELIEPFETQRRHKDGHLIDVSVTISPILDAAGVVVGASKIARDITEAKRVDAELERHREHLEDLVEERTAQIAETTDQLRQRDKFITAIADNIPGMVGYWDRELLCRFANRGFSEWFGIEPEAMIGTSMRESFGAVYVDKIIPKLQSVLRGESQQSIREIRKPSGDVGYVAVHYIPDRKDGVVIGFFVLSIDISARKQVEAELVQANREMVDAVASAQHANAAKSRFLANMSHEIRTPMSGVLGMLDILGHTQLDDEQSRMVDTISGSAQSLMQIIDDILDLSKIEAGHLKVEAIACDPTQIVESTTRLYLGAATTKGLVLRCFVAPNIRGRFLIDPVRLRQVLSNLVSNAVKFTARGSVTITAEDAGGEEQATALRFVIEDTGIGISPEAQVRLFQPFTQADDSTARKYGGTGLGLSICLRLAELMGGEIRLESRKDKGTKLTVVVPAMRSPEDPVQTVLDLCGVTVGLLARDELEQFHLSAYLEDWGAEVKPISGTSASPPKLAPGTIIVAPLSAMELVRAIADDADADATAAPWHRRFVFYTHEDVPTDWHPATDAIATTALSRARIITAVAVAAGRKSPEVEAVRALAKLEPQDVSSRDQAIREGRLILLAEDHPVNREVILRQLHLLGYAADAVENGVEALTALAHTRYGLLLTDCNMPEMDGFELAKFIRDIETDGKHLPIIALTANALDGEDRRCIAAGMDDYLSKPAKLTTLRTRLEHWLSARPTLAVESISEDLQGHESGVAEPAFDLAVLAEFCGKDPTALRDILERYVVSLKADLEKLSEAVARSDAKAVELFAHRMKGAALAVGGNELARCSASIEIAAGMSDWIAIDRDLAPLSEAITKIDLNCAEIAST